MADAVEYEKRVRAIEKEHERICRRSRDSKTGLTAEEIRKKWLYGEWDMNDITYGIRNVKKCKMGKKTTVELTDGALTYEPTVISLK